MTEFPRRIFLKGAAGAAAAPLLPNLAAALDYPTRPVRWINGFAPGGAPDVIARLLGQWLAARLGQNFIVENRPGAGTNIATETVARASADGYTLLLVASPNLINASLYAHLQFDFVRDIAPVGTIGAQSVRHGEQCRRFRPRPLPNSSPMPKPIRARST